MKRERRVHRFTPSLLIGSLLVGGASTLLAIGAAVYNYGDLIAGNMSLLDYAGFFLVIPFIFSSGVFLLARPIVTRIVTSSQGLAYYTLFYIVKIDWDEIKQLPKDEDPRRRLSAGEAREIDFPQIKPRPWTRFARLDAKKRAMEQGIPLYMFGGYRGRQLMSDIRKYMPHLDIR